MTMATMAKMDSPAEEAMPDEMAESAAVKTGQFRDADRFHRGSGTATIYSLPDGSHVLQAGVVGRHERPRPCRHTESPPEPEQQ